MTKRQEAESQITKLETLIELNSIIGEMGKAIFVINKLEENTLKCYGSLEEMLMKQDEIKPILKLHILREN